MHTHRPEVSGSDSHLGTRCVFCFYSTRDDFPPTCTTTRRWWLFLDHDDALKLFLKLQDWDQMIFHLLPIGGFCYSRFTGFFVRVIIVYTSVYFFHFLSQNFARLCYPAKKKNIFVIGVPNHCMEWRCKRSLPFTSQNCVFNLQQNYRKKADKNTAPFRLKWVDKSLSHIEMITSIR